jgi:hypothetical protein
MNKLERIGILIVEMLNDILKTFGDGVQLSDYEIIPRALKRAKMIYNLILDGVLNRASPKEYAGLSETLTKEFLTAFPVMNESKGEFGTENAELFLSKIRAIIVDILEMSKDGLSTWEGVKLVPSLISLSWTTKDAYKELKDLNTEETAQIVGALALEITHALKGKQ